MQGENEGPSSIDEYDNDALQTVYEDSKRNIDHQITVFRNLSTKCEWTARLTLVILGLFVGILGSSYASVLTENQAFGLSLIFFAASLLTAALGFRTREYTSGPGIGDFDDFVRSPESQTEWMVRMINRGYIAWGHEIQDINNKKAFLLNLSQYFLYFGIGALLIGETLM